MFTLCTAPYDSVRRYETRLNVCGLLHIDLCLQWSVCFRTVSCITQIQTLAYTPRICMCLQPRELFFVVLYEKIAYNFKTIGHILTHLYLLSNKSG